MERAIVPYVFVPEDISRGPMPAAPTSPIQIEDRSQINPNVMERLLDNFAQVKSFDMGEKAANGMYSDLKVMKEALSECMMLLKWDQERISSELRLATMVSFVFICGLGFLFFFELL